MGKHLERYVGILSEESGGGRGIKVWPAFLHDLNSFHDPVDVFLEKLCKPYNEIWLRKKKDHRAVMIHSLPDSPSP